MKSVGLAEIPRIVEAVQPPPVVWLRGLHYPSFLVSIIREVVQKKAIQLLSLSLQDTSFEAIQQSSACSFLGETYWYSLGDCTDVPKKKQDQWRVYASGYAGPHTLIFYAPALFVRDVPNTWSVVDLPESVTIQEFERIALAWYGVHDTVGIMSLIKVLYRTDQVISCEQLFIVPMYASVVGKSLQDFVASYQRALVAVVPGLSLLSQHFFSKNKMAFYKEWAQQESLYQALFWITFWSEQLWRACAYIVSMQKNDRTSAYEISKNRLPYTFTKNGWRTIQSESLREAHAMLYTLDLLLKNGGDAASIELFYIRWFSAS
jgi:hypothetical protein